jgi:hypothetical protein
MDWSFKVNFEPYIRGLLTGKRSGSQYNEYPHRFGSQIMPEDHLFEYAPSLYGKMTSVKLSGH